MQTNITNRTLGSIKPQDKPYEIRDTGLKGLILRVQPSGVMTYYLEFKRGKRVRVGRADAITPVQARDIAKLTLADVYHGQDPTIKNALSDSPTYLEFLEASKEELLAHLRTGKETYYRLKNTFTELHDLKLSEINVAVVDKWRLRRKTDGRKLASINRELNDLRALLGRAVRQDLLEKHPLEKLKAYKIDSCAKVRFLGVDEEARLRCALNDREKAMVAARANCNVWRLERGYKLYATIEDGAFADHLKPAVLLSLNTGLRRGELFALKWLDVDFERNNLTVVGESAKSGKTRHVPLNEEAAAILRAWKKQSEIKDTLVFAGKDGKPFNDVRTSWVGALKDAKVENFRWHDLRHTFASNLVMRGVDLNTVRELLGHSDYKMTLRYAHLAPEHKAAAVNKLVAPIVASSVVS